MAKVSKKDVEVLLVKAEIVSLPERRLVKTRNLVCADLIWPRKGVARKSAAREAVIRRGRVDFSGELWANRVLFREEIEGHSALAVSITESVTVQNLKVVKIDSEKNLIAIKGAIPGAKDGIVFIRDSVKA